MRRIPLALCIASFLIVMPLVRVTSDTPLTVQYAAATVLHDPIVIFGNDEFTAENGVVGGDGTYEDPFIIEGWEIDLANEQPPEGGMMLAGINIQNTNAWFVIRNVYVHSGNEALASPAPGVVFAGVYCAELRDSRISGNENGVHIVYSSIVEIENCTITENTLGITADGCSGIAIVNNTVSNNERLNVDMSRIITSRIIGNNLSYSGDWTSVGLYMCEECTMNNNTISHNPALGLNLGYCKDCEVTYNTITDNRIGINMYGSENMVVEENSFSGNEDNMDGQGDESSISVPLTVAVVVAAAMVSLVIAYVIAVRNKKPEKPVPPQGSV
ncbi:MAG TPA: right-handed parallel beta-helix repeat-containing protein [Thermoplasmata archaeon]